MTTNVWCYPACRRQRETMMVDCAVPFRVPRHDERRRRTSTTPPQRPGQGHRCPGPAPPTQHSATQPGWPASAFHTSRQGCPRRAAQFATTRSNATTSAPGQPQPHPAMTLEPAHPSPRAAQPAQALRPTPDYRLDPTTDTAPGPRESDLGLPAHPRRTVPGSPKRPRPVVRAPSWCPWSWPRARRRGHVHDAVRHRSRPPIIQLITSQACGIMLCHEW